MEKSQRNCGGGQRNRGCLRDCLLASSTVTSLFFQAEDSDCMRLFCLTDKHDNEFIYESNNSTVHRSAPFGSLFPNKVALRQAPPPGKHRSLLPWRQKIGKCLPKMCSLVSVKEILHETQVSTIKSWEVRFIANQSPQKLPPKWTCVNQMTTKNGASNQDVVAFRCISCPSVMLDAFVATRKIARRPSYVQDWR